MSVFYFQYAVFLVFVFVAELSTGAAGFIYKNKVDILTFWTLFYCYLCLFTLNKMTQNLL